MLQPSPLKEISSQDLERGAWERGKMHWPSSKKDIRYWGRWKKENISIIHATFPSVHEQHNTL
jgi:hypothetical protein